MTKEETIKILAMLGAFYGGGKADPVAQANAWHAILRKYDYKTAEQAVLNFAENDVRDYATFPAVGKIVQAIRQEDKNRIAPVKEIVRAVSYGWQYSQLSDTARLNISEERYNEWLNMNAEEFQSRMRELSESIRTDKPRLGGSV